MSYLAYCPIGTVMPYSGASAPSGWFFCDGSEKSITINSNLYSVIGLTYGAASAGNFKLPDLRGRIVVGKDDMGGSAANRITTAISGINGLLLGSSGGAENYTLAVSELPSHTHIQDAHTHIQDAHNHPFSDNVRQALLDMAGGSTRFSGNINNDLVANNTDSPTAINQNTTAINQNTGGGTAHNNVQPTLILNYIIKF